MVVRLKSRQPDGSVVGESRRVCHLVAVPDSDSMPEFLVGYCGVRIFPGAAEILPAAVGMPCEPCMARSPISAFAMLRQFRDRLGIQSP
jgi:hypothetical protein